MSDQPGKSRSALLALVFTFTLAGALTVGALVAYPQVAEGFENQLKRRLKSYAATTAMTFNAEALATIPSDDDPVAVLYRKRLQALEKYAGVRRAAILDRDGNLILKVADGHVDDFDADAKELAACFAQAGPVVTVEYEGGNDRAYRNGFAPILDDNDQPSRYAVAVALETDYSARLDAVGLSMIATVIGVFVVTLGTALLLGSRWEAMRRDLSKQKRLAEQAQFSAGMAHQIKNPLAALRGYVELLSRGLEEPNQKKIASRLIAEIGALDRVVREFLAFSRGAHGSEEKLAFRTAIEPVLEAARARCGDGVEVELASQDVGDLDIDTTALKEALANVAVNAVEAMSEEGEGGKLTIRAHGNTRLVTVEFQDSGPGIPEDVKSRLFDPFVTGKADGTGLGLAIARRLLRDLGGDLELVSTGPSGTTFRATFQRRGD